MSEHIISDTSDGVLTLTMNRADKKNALTDAMYTVMADAITAAQGDGGVRAIVIRGEGDLFCAGNDIAEFAAVAMGGPKKDGVWRFLRAIADNDKPLIAAVQGKAVGIGLTMLLHCDIVVLAQDALLSVPFVNLALVPEAASSLLLPARIGHARAYAMFALGEAANAQDALAWGLANKVVARDALDATARDYAARLAKQPLGALVATKKLMRDAEAVKGVMAAEGEVFAARLRTPEAGEAFAAFAERRAADFSRF